MGLKASVGFFPEDGKVLTSKSLLAAMNPGQRDILSDREPPEHHSSEYITSDGICRTQEPGHKKRGQTEARSNSSSCTARKPGRESVQESRALV